MSFEIGTCCFCNGECNPSSQTCGSCARKITGYALGNNNYPGEIKNIMYILYG